jgi:hypothetical protein
MDFFSWAFAWSFCRAFFVWEFSQGHFWYGHFRMGVFAWAFSHVCFHIGVFAWVFSHGRFRTGVSHLSFRMGVFAWEFSHGSFRTGVFALEFSHCGNYFNNNVYIFQYNSYRQLGLGDEMNRPIKIHHFNDAIWVT